MPQQNEIQVTTDSDGRVWIEQWRWVPEDGYGNGGAWVWLRIYELTALFRRD